MQWTLSMTVPSVMENRLLTAPSIVAIYSDNFDEGRAISRAKSPGKEKHINCLLNPFNLETIIMVSVVLDFASPAQL